MFNFKLSGSSGNWWNKLAKNFKVGGEGGSLLTGLKKGLSSEQNPLLSKGANKLWRNLGGNKLIGDKGKIGIYEHNKAWSMDKSRKFSPLWEGGLSGTGGSLHQDLLPWLDKTGMKASHHLMGTEVEGYGSGGKNSGSASSTVATNSEAEDPSLINDSNWTMPGSLASNLRREAEKNMGRLSTDVAGKTQRGRKKVATINA